MPTRQCPVAPVTARLPVTGHFTWQQALSLVLTVPAASLSARYTRICTQQVAAAMLAACVTVLFATSAAAAHMAVLLARVATG